MDKLQNNFVLFDIFKTDEDKDRKIKIPESHRQYSNLVKIIEVGPKCTDQIEAGKQAIVSSIAALSPINFNGRDCYIGKEDVILCIEI